MKKQLREKYKRLLIKHSYVSTTLKNIKESVKVAYSLKDNNSIESLKYTRKIFKRSIYRVSEDLKEIKYLIRNEDRKYSLETMYQYRIDYKNRFGFLPNNRLTRKRIDEFYLKYYNQ